MTPLFEIVIGLLLLAWVWAVAHWQFLIVAGLGVLIVLLLVEALHVISDLRKDIAELQKGMDEGLSGLIGKLDDAEYRESLRDITN